MIIKKIPKWTKTIECKYCSTIYKISSKEAFRNHMIYSYPYWHLYVTCPFCHEQYNVSVAEFFKEVEK